jgi:hypothetical protein
MELLVDRDLTVTPERLERLHQAALFYADKIRIRATTRIVPDRVDLCRRMHELRDIGAITTWAHEYEVDGGGVVRTEHWSSLFGGPADLVLPAEKARELVNGVDSELRVKDAAALVEQSSLREGIAEVVQFRRSLIAFRLADTLSADGLILGGRHATFPHIREYSDTVETIVELCTFGTLSALPIKAIVQCRREMPAFRRYLDLKLAGQTGDHDPRALAREIMNEYQQLLVRYAGSHTARDTVLDASWDVVGAVLPPAVLVKYLTKPLSWARRRQDFAPFLLLSRLRASL